jgi:hypothetical protein
MPTILKLISQKSMKIVKSRRMRWLGHVTGMGEKRNVYRKTRRKKTARKTKT